MPSTEGLKLLIRREKLTDKNWISLIVARHALIRSHLKSVTLPELGELKCLKTESFTHPLKEGGPTVNGYGRFSLETQGIFHKSWDSIERIKNSGHRPPPGGVHVPDGTMRIWGLTRSGEWIVATVHYVGLEGYKARGFEQATHVEIQEIDVGSLIAVTKEKPQHIWEELGKTIKAWAEWRKILYDDALNLSHMVEIEELAISLIPEDI